MRHAPGAAINGSWRATHSAFSARRSALDLGFDLGFGLDGNGLPNPGPSQFAAISTDGDFCHRAVRLLIG